MNLSIPFPLNQDIGHICWKRLLRFFFRDFHQTGISGIHTRRTDLPHPGHWSPHYGYFSLWLQSRHPEIELSSLMIEPSPSFTRSLHNLANQEILDGRFSYLQRAIGLPIPKAVLSTIDLTWPVLDIPYLNQKKPSKFKI